ncbi:MAG: polysaccharide lyase family protein [Verrucomicrobiota bacterium]
MKNIVIPLLVTACHGLLLTVVPAAEARTLWQIGKTDHSNAEFALAPNGFSQFKQDAFFVIGESDPHHDWPYVHPGPGDSWAGARPHTFTILFGVQGVPAAGECKLCFDLLDTQHSSPPKLHIEVNGTQFDQQMPAGAGDASVLGDPAKGKPYQFSVAFPADLLKPGNNQIDISNVAGSWVLYDSVSLVTQAAITTAPVVNFADVRSVRSTPALVDKGGKLFQPVALSVVCLGTPQDAAVCVNGAETGRVKLAQGSQEFETLVPAVDKVTQATISLVTDGKTLASRTLTLTPVRKWEVYVLMHSHTDIGYTDIQPNIEKKQAQNVIRALDLIRATKDYPAGAKFKWNLEVMWTADQFARVATPQQLREFDQAVRDGDIGVDAMYGNLLTGLCRYEEMVRQISYATTLGQRNGRQVDSMMISDVPGMTWGVVPALASHGVKYISNGPNASRTMDGDRIGYVRVQWENTPFYWESPSGTEKVLYWGAQGGYSFGHHFASIQQGLPFLLDRLEEQKYPYDIVQLRWTKGDNGPPDEGVMPALREWNAKYAYPKLVIATTSEAFHAFEKRYGDKLPTFRGDMTPYWEDGAGSSARETALNRHSVDRLLQAETLWAMRKPGAFPLAEFAVAWKNAAMYSEHTWGAHNSISQPDLAFVKNQWNYKQGYALTADRVSRELLGKALGGLGRGDGAVDVFNTASWERSDLVTLPKETRGDCVKDADGKPVPSQRLASGELAFLAGAVPPLGSKRFLIGSGTPGTAKAAVAATSLTTPLLQIKLDPASGDIVSLRREGIDGELANGKINNYIYLPGGNLKDAKPAGAAKISVKEAGPLVVSLLVESDAPGCNKLEREVRLIDGIDRVEIIDLVDKQALRAVEGVHFGFSFNIAEPKVHINSPGAIGQPEIDQLAGACKNWFSVERWVDISNATQGVTWSTADAPLMEMGGLTANLPRSQPDPNAYLKRIEPSATIYSWVMNNHWHTNYRADQEGPTWFRYALRPHRGYDAAAATRFGVESTQPLIAAPATAGLLPAAGWLRLDGDQVIVSSLKPSEDGQACMLRLYNPTEQAQTTTLHWSKPVGQTWLSSALEEQGRNAPAAITVPKLGTVTLRVMP